MAKGDHIYRRMKITGGNTDHHGIDCGNGTVIHYHGTFPDITIRRVSIYAFADGEIIFTEKYGKCDSPEVVVQRAISKLGEKNYHLLFNNCEHFARYCKTGRSDSKQVNKFIPTIGGVGGGSFIAAGTKVATKAAAEAAKQSLNPISKTLVNLGIKQAPTVAGRAAAGIAGVGGLASGIATDMVVGKIMEDDEHLTNKEREARKKGRQAGQIASTVGGVAGTVAACTIGGSAAVAAGVAAPAVLGVGAAIAAYNLSKNKKPPV